MEKFVGMGLIPCSALSWKFGQLELQFVLKLFEETTPSFSIYTPIP
jgi:hypothetical protein